LTKDGKLESRLSHSDRSEVFATKFQELPKSGEDEEDVEDFFNRPPPPRLTRWQRFRNLFPRDNDKVQKTLNKIEYYEQPIKLGVVLLAILLAIGIFIRWRRRRNGTEGAPGGSRGQVAPSE
jgi:hypothetical protein